MVVVFPEPLGPSSPKTPPSGTWRDSSSTARMGPYSLVRLRVSMTQFALLSMVPPSGPPHGLPRPAVLPGGPDYLRRCCMDTASSLANSLNPNILYFQTPVTRVDNMWPNLYVAQSLLDVIDRPIRSGED